MDLSALRIRGTGAFVALAALTILGAGSMQAATTFVFSNSSPTVTCNTLTGPGASTTFTVHLAAAQTTTTTITLTPANGAGVTVTPSAPQVLAIANTPITYTVTANAGCTGSASTVLSFSATGVTTSTVTATDTITTGVPVVTGAVSGPTPTCNTVAGPGTTPGVITLTLTNPIVGPATVAVTAPTVSGFAITPVAGTSFTSSISSLVYHYLATTGCTPTSGSAAFTVAGASGPTTVSLTETATVVNPLVVSPPSGITVQCVYSSTGGGTWTPGPAQTVSLSTLAPGGSTAYTVNSGTNGETAPASWLTLSASSGTATTSGITFTMQAAASTTGPTVHGCGGYTTTGSHVTTVNLDVAGAPTKPVTVTLQMVSPSVLTVSPTKSLTYVKGSGTPAYVDLPVSSTPSGLFLSINQASLPNWLTVDSTTGTLPKSFRFSTTSVCDTLPPGTYTATVYLQVAGYADTPVSISLLLTNKAPTLSVSLPPVALSPGLQSTSTTTMQNINWVVGSPAPTTTIIAQSSDSPIGFTAAGGGAAGPIPSTTSGVAYNFGTEIGVTFNQVALASAVPGTVLNGTVTLTWGSSNSTIVVTFNISVLSAAPTLTSVLPASIPTATAPNHFTVTLSGTGFVGGTDAALATKLGIVVGGSIVTDSNLTPVVSGSSTILLTINVPAVGADTNLTQFATPGALELGICNPAGSGSCTTPQATILLNIGAGPIVQAVTSASSFKQGSPTTTAPFDIITIWGANFCPTCGSSGIAFGTPDPITQLYPQSLALPADPNNGNAVHYLTATFYNHLSAGSGTWLGNAPLLFATNNQINLVVPANVSTATGTVDVVVTYNSTNAVPASSATEPATGPGTYNLTIAATDPGMFTVGADGQGNAAILNAITYQQITQASPAGMRSVGTDSDTVALYVTGLGIPDSTATDTSGGTMTNITDCISTTAYISALQALPGATNTTMDGAVILPSVIDPSRLPPCMANTSTTTVPAVTIGNVAATSVGFAGFVDTAITGLYQINVTLPVSSASFTTPAGCGPTPPQTPCTTVSLTGPVALPIQISSQGQTSQAGVTIWVAPRLLMTASPTSISGMVDQAVTGQVTASEGSGTGQYTYAITAGTLPAGLLFNTGTGAITGTPVANTGGNYSITVTATDQTSPIPLTGSVTIPIFIQADLFMTQTAVANPAGTHGSLISNVTTVKATGGLPPYTYTLGTVTPAAGGSASDVVLSSTGEVSMAASAVAGTYSVTVNSSDSTANNALTGSITFSVTLQ